MRLEVSDGKPAVSGARQPPDLSGIAR
jgi:hypothetical protein